MNTYETYRDMRDAMTIEECVELHKEIKEAVEQDEIANELYRDLLDASWEYMEYRFEWGRKDLQGRVQIDARRSDKHNAVLRKFDFLGRQLTVLGKEIPWTEVLGDCEMDPTKRKRYGDFAMYLCFVETINQR